MSRSNENLINSYQLLVGGYLSGVYHDEFMTAMQWVDDGDNTLDALIGF